MANRSKRKGKRLGSLRRHYDELDGRCFYCGCKMSIKTNEFGVLIKWQDCERKPNQFTIDHFYPKSKNGDNRGHNFVGSCRKCNEDKQDRMPTDEEIKRFEHLLMMRRIRNVFSESGANNDQKLFFMMPGIGF